MKYRPEIDGLRALAVLPVLFFHAGFSAFSGGFVGVDIFFVISGYLITTILLTDLQQNRFSIGCFYERRARRILPALFLVLLCCLPLGWVWLVPADMVDFSESLISALLFYSNFFFWQNSDYFALESEFRPLLHTWSLAVEEQYYILFPPALWLIWRYARKTLFPLLVLGVLGSLLLSEIVQSRIPQAAFYLLPTRAWELLLGGLVAWCALYRPFSLKWHWLSDVGLLAILFSVFCYDDTIPFPGLYAIPPVLGACLIIAFATPKNLSYRLLSWKPMVAIGLISYSLYLWHQPLFAFARHQAMAPVAASVFGALIILSILLAALSWKYVEQPFRHAQRISLRTLILSGVTGFALLMAFALWMVQSHGYVQRFAFKNGADSFLAYFAKDGENRYSQREKIDEHFREDCNFYDLASFAAGTPTQQPVARITPNCYERDASKPHALMIWGDSYAQMLQYGLRQQIGDDWNLLQIASSGCRPGLQLKDNPAHYCQHSNYVALQTIQTVQPDVVIISQRTGHQVEIWDQLQRTLTELGVKQVIFVGPPPQWTHDLPYILVQKLWDTKPEYTDFGLQKELFESDQKLQNAAQAHQWHYISLMDYFCRQGACRTRMGEDIKADITTYDKGHLALRTSAHVANDLLLPALTAATSSPVPSNQP